MKLEKNWIFILQFDLGNDWPNQKLVFQYDNLLSVSLTKSEEDEEDEIRGDGGTFSR